MAEEVQLETDMTEVMASATLGEIQPQIDEFNSRGQAFEAIMGVLCGRIDNLNEQMAYSLAFIPRTQQRLNKLEIATKNLAFNIYGFEGTTTSEQPALLQQVVLVRSGGHTVG